MALNSYVGDLFKGGINVNNASSIAFTADALWGYGIWNAGTQNFTFRTLILFDNYSFAPGLNELRTITYSTPNDPGTWSICGVLAEKIVVDPFNITGQYDMDVVENAWIIEAIPISVSDVLIMPVL